MITSESPRLPSTWPETGVPEKLFGWVGRVDLFVVGRKAEEGFRLATRILSGPDRGGIEFGSTPHPDTDEAQ